MSPGDSVLHRVGLRLGSVAAPDRDDVDTIGLRGSAEDLPVDVGGGQQTEAHCSHPITPLVAGYKERKRG